MRYFCSFPLVANQLAIRRLLELAIRSLGFSVSLLPFGARALQELLQAVCIAPAVAPMGGPWRHAWGRTVKVALTRGWRSDEVIATLRSQYPRTTATAGQLNLTGSRLTTLKTISERLLRNSDKYNPKVSVCWRTVFCRGIAFWRVLRFPPVS